MPDDNLPRKKLFKPFKLPTKLGVIEVEGVSNTCGCFVANFQNILALEREHPDVSKIVLAKSFGKLPGQSRRYFGDGVYSHGLSYFWNKDQTNIQNADEDFAIYNVYDYALGNHLNGNGINAPHIPDFSTSVPSHNWKEIYLSTNPRLS